MEMLHLFSWTEWAFLLMLFSTVSAALNCLWALLKKSKSDKDSLYVNSRTGFARPRVENILAQKKPPSGVDYLPADLEYYIHKLDSKKIAFSTFVSRQSSVYHDSFFEKLENGADTTERVYDVLRAITVAAALYQQEIPVGKVMLDSKTRGILELWYEKYTSIFVRESDIPQRPKTSSEADPELYFPINALVGNIYDKYADSVIKFYVTYSMLHKLPPTVEYLTTTVNHDIAFSSRRAVKGKLVQGPTHKLQPWEVRVIMTAWAVVSGNRIPQAYTAKAYAVRDVMERLEARMPSAQNKDKTQAQPT